jgi:hypothetical protein
MRSNLAFMRILIFAYLWVKTDFPLTIDRRLAPSCRAARETAGIGSGGSGGSGSTPCRPVSGSPVGEEASDAADARPAFRGHLERLKRSNRTQADAVDFTPCQLGRARRPVTER